MGNLQVALLGGVHVSHNNWLSEAKLTREIQVLLAYLLLQRHRAPSRDMLASVLCGDHGQEKARRALNTALWRLKKVLEPEGVPHGTYLLCTSSWEVSFNFESQYWLDVEAFEKQTIPLITCSALGVDELHVKELEKTLELYRGELLEGFYDDWALRERERLRATYIKSLVFLMEYYRCHGKYETSSSYGQQILKLEPLREDIHREMMRLFLESGQRALAAWQYEICRVTLAKELGILPMEETQMLYAQIFPEVHKSHLSSVSAETLSFEQALVQLQEASDTITLARAQIQQALLSLAKYKRAED